MNVVGYTAAALRYVSEFARFRKLSAGRPQLMVRWADRIPCLKERTKESGFDRHYIYHTAWAGRALAALRPAEHVDISSSLYFCSIVSSFVPVRYYEFRPPQLTLDNLTVESADLSRLSFESGSIASLSCMHVVEHPGLGRYGDPLDPEADLVAMKELGRVLAPQGSLLFVVPVGAPRVRFNAHRIYSYDHIRSCFARLRLRQYAFIPDSFADGNIVYDPPQPSAGTGGDGCGCFWFTKDK